MMKRTLQALLGYILALMLTVSLTGACVLTVTNRLLTDQALYARVAADKRVTAAQMARVETTVRQLSETYSFDPEPVMALLSHEQFADYGQDMAAWWTHLLGGTTMAEAPFPDTNAITEAVLADERFIASIDAFMLRTVARDEVAYPIGKAMQVSAMPVRLSLLMLAMPRIEERIDIPAMLGYLSALRTILWVASGVLLALLLLTQGKYRLPTVSAGLLASFVLLAMLTVAVLIVNLPGYVAEFSALLALQIRVLQGALLPSVLLTEAALLLIGVLLPILCLKKREPAYRGRHEREPS